MHQSLQGRRDVPVVNEEILLYPESFIMPLQIAGPISFNPMPQNQILRARRRPNRIRLHERHPLQCPSQRRRSKERSPYRKAPQIIERQFQFQPFIATLTTMNGDVQEIEQTISPKAPPFIEDAA
jgi:hypothetical protein